MNILTGITIFSALSFLFFGLACLFDHRMRAEFIRYRLESKRRLTGFLQLLGGFGLFLGWLFSPRLALASALGLSILMLLGFGVRIKIKDTWLQSLPSLSYALVNGYLTVSYFNML